MLCSLGLGWRLCHSFHIRWDISLFVWPVQKDQPIVVVTGQPLNSVHPFFFRSDELNLSCIVSGTHNKAFLWILFMRISVCAYVHFVEAHISPLVYALRILSGIHISLVFLHSILCVLVKFPHSRLYWCKHQAQRGKPLF